MVHIIWSIEYGSYNILASRFENKTKSNRQIVLNFTKLDHLETILINVSAFLEKNHYFT